MSKKHSMKSVSPVSTSNLDGLRGVYERRSSSGQGAVWEAAILASTGAALALLGENGLTSRAVWIGSGVICAWTLVRRVPIPSAALWFILSYLGLFYVLPVVDPSPLGWRPLGETYTSITIGGLHAFMATWLLVGSDGGKGGTGNTRLDQLRQVAPIVGVGATVVSVIGALLIIGAGGGVGDWWSMSRVEVKESVTWVTQVGGYAMLLTPVGLLSAPFILRNRWTAGWAILIINSWVVAVNFAHGRPRTPVVAGMIALAIGFCYSQTKSPRPLTVLRFLREGRAGLATLAIGMIAVLAVGLGLRVVRAGVGSGGAVERIVSVGAEGTLSLGLGKGWDAYGDIGYAPVVLQAMEYSDRYGVQLSGQSYYRPILMPVPRSIWEDKPVSTPQLVGGWFSAQEVHSQPPGAQGDAYLNFGAWGYLVFVGLGVLLGLIDRSRRVAVLIVVASGFPIFYSFARGSFGNQVVAFLFMLVTVGVLVMDVHQGGQFSSLAHRAVSMSGRRVERAVGRLGLGPRGDHDQGSTRR
jgi:hypothetical protein